MRKTLLLAVAAASLCASSAFAQVSVGVPGVGGVTVGEPGYRDGYRERDRRSYNSYDRDSRRERRDRDYDRRDRRDRGDRVYIERD